MATPEKARDEEGEGNRLPLLRVSGLRVGGGTVASAELLPNAVVILFSALGRVWLLMSQTVSPEPDVLVLGGGIAGLTAAATLARAGLQVRCIEPHRFPRTRVGESLDWSAPALLAEVGLDRSAVVEKGAGTLKREVHGIASGRRMVAGPPGWFELWPLQFERVTLHVDRERFDRKLFESAVNAGVDFVWDRIHDVRMVADRVVGCVDSIGATHRATWYIDASGQSRLLGRTAHIGQRSWGRKRVGLWSQRMSPMSIEGTVLHLDDSAEELTWAWEIPIGPDRVSVGVVLPLDEFKALRCSAGSAEAVFANVVKRFPSLDLGDAPTSVMTRVFRPYVSNRVVGANWVMVGEAAALVDPLSSHGVTAALRHGTEAAQIVVRSRQRPSATHRLLSDYDRRVRAIAKLYNEALDGLLYRAEIRGRYGIKQAGRAYVILGYLINALYTRLEPAKSWFRQSALGFVLGFFRLWTRAWLTAARAGRETR